MNLRQIILGLCFAVLISIGAIRSGLTASLCEIPFDLRWLRAAATNYALQNELLPLSSHDVVLLIDRSRSMLTNDCFPAFVNNNIAREFYTPMSRWQWCHEQTLQLTKKTERALPNGLTVVLFAKKYVTYRDAKIDSVERIFADGEPDGGTDTAAALNSQIEAYFVRKSKFGEHTKPVLIAIISDGCPDNPALFCQAIVEASQSMNQSGEISITFLQVGNDHRAIYLLKKLKNGLLDQNAKFNIVNIIPFSELNKIGLPQALIDVTTMHSKLTAKTSNQYFAP